MLTGRDAAHKRIQAC
ncbi:hypothetical protein [Vibrio fortis]